MATPQRLSDIRADRARDAVRVAIAVRTPAIQAGITAALADDPRFRVEAVATDPSDLPVSSDRPCDVVLLVTETPVRDGASVLEDLNRRRSPSRLLVIAANETPEDIPALLGMGVRGLGFLPQLQLEDFRQAVLAMASTGTWACKLTTSHLVQLVGDTPLPVATYPDSTPPISKQELEVLRLTASGRSEPEIANELCLSRSTVRTYVARIRKNFGCTAVGRL
jgi:DNA-binding NarL/FixJ family response regulator